MRPPKGHRPLPDDELPRRLHGLRIVFCFTTDPGRDHLTVAAHGVPDDSTCTAGRQSVSMRNWCDMIVRSGVEHVFWPEAATSRSTTSAAARHHQRDGAPRCLVEALRRDWLDAKRSLARRTASSGRASGDGANHERGLVGVEWRRALAPVSWRRRRAASAASGSSPRPNRSGRDSDADGKRR